MIEIHRPPKYVKLKIEIPSERVELLEELVEYVKTLGEWESQNATASLVLEYIVERHLDGSTPEAKEFRRWKKAQLTDQRSPE